VPAWLTRPGLYFPAGGLIRNAAHGLPGLGKILFVMTPPGLGRRRA